MRVREIAQQIGLLLIVLLMVLAFYNDFVRIFTGGP
jgi:regulator of sigma E protease